MAEFTSANTATIKMNVDMTTDGFIAQSGDTVASTKKPILHGLKANATLAEADKVYGFFYATLAGGTYDSLSAVKNITQEVAD